MRGSGRAAHRLYPLFVAEEVGSVLRHAAVNKFAGIGALLFHLKRKLQKNAPDAWDVFPLIEAEVAAGAERLNKRFLPEPLLPERAPELAALLAVVAEAQAWPTEVQPVAMPGGPVCVQIDPAELEVALWCVLENAIELTAAAGGGRVRFGCRATERPGEGLLGILEIASEASAVADQEAGPLSITPELKDIGFSVAKRIADRWRGRFVLERQPGALKAALELPRANS